MSSESRIDAQAVEGVSAMSAKTYSLIAAMVFAAVALLQLARAWVGLPVVVGSIDVPVSASWLACFVAFLLTALGFIAALVD
jgi:hypothetical protein